MSEDEHTEKGQETIVLDKAKKAHGHPSESVGEVAARTPGRRSGLRGCLYGLEADCGAGIDVDSRIEPQRGEAMQAIQTLHAWRILKIPDDESKE